MPKNRKHNKKNHVAGGIKEEQNVDGTSNENEHMAMDPNVHDANDTQTNGQSKGDTQLSEPSIERNQVSKLIMQTWKMLIFIQILANIVICCELHCWSFWRR